MVVGLLVRQLERLSAYSHLARLPDKRKVVSADDEGRRTPPEHPHGLEQHASSES